METLTLIIDAQNDFVSGALRNEEAIKIVPNIVELCNKSNENKIPIWFTRDSHNSNYLNTSEGKKLPIPHCLIGTFGWNIIDELKPFTAGKIVDKTTFGSVDLAINLAKRPELKHIYVAGFCTDICVIGNILMIKSFRPDIEIHLLKDCCAGSTSEKHAAAISVAESCQMDIIELKDIQ